MNTSGQGGSGTRNGKSANGGAGGIGNPVGGGADPEVAVIGSGVRIKGDVEADVDLQIDGQVHGDVRCETVILSEGALVSGSIVAERVRIAGKVDGGIEATDLAIENGARIKGDVTYSRLRISNGGIFEGSMTHRPLPEQAAGEEERLKLVAAEAPKPQRVHYID